MQDSKYGEVKTYHYENAVVRVHRPELTPNERARRMKEIQRAAENLLLEALTRKGESA